MVANLLGGRSLFCGVERTCGLGTALASFFGFGCGVDIAIGAGVSEMTGSFSGCGMGTGGLKIGRCRGGELGITGTGEVWEETGGSVDAEVGKDSGDGVGLVPIVVSGCC